ncbi:MAG: hypothetical protein ACKVOK_08235 [Flavobacteriales bacterium]
MKISILTLSILLTCLAGFAQSTRKDITGDYFHLTGKVYEVDMFEGTEKSAVATQIIVYQEKELYVAFYTEKNGLYEFYLPTGFQYEIWYGGSSFVNKIVTVDSRMLPKSKKPSKLDLDIGLFRPVEGHEFPMLNEPYVQVIYDEEMASLIPDFEYTDEKSAQLEKIFRKLKKEMAKKS